MAAVLGSLLPEDTEPDRFIRMLGIEKAVADVGGVDWTLPKDLLPEVTWQDADAGTLLVTRKVLNRIEAELGFPHFRLRGIESPRVDLASGREFSRFRWNAGTWKNPVATKAHAGRPRWRR